MKLWKAVVLFALLVAACAVPAQSDRRIRLAFSDTDVSQVLKAISLRTNANIVYSNQTKIPVTFNVSVDTVEEAIQSTTSAAGLVYRKVGDIYVVALPEGIKQALQPYTMRVTFTPKAIDSAQAAKLLQDNLPDATVTDMGSMIAVRAILADINLAEQMLADADRRAATIQLTDSVLALKHIAPSQAAAAGTAMFPDLKFVAIGDDKIGGSVTISGPAARVERARQVLVGLDEAPAGSGVTFHTYTLKYTSAPDLKTFLEKAVPGVEVHAAPEAYAPLRAGFRPLSGASVTSQSSGGQGGGQGGGQAGGQGGQGAQGGGQGGQGGGGQGGQTRPYKEGDYATTVVLKGNASDVAAALRLAEQLDVRPEQIMIEVRVVETSPNFSEQLGMDWSWTRFGFFETPAGGSFAGDLPTPNRTRPSGFGQITRAPWSFAAFLNAQITNRESKLLASPSLTVLNNNEASIFIGDTIRARIAQSSGLGGQTIEIVEFPVGIILLVRPRLNANGDITMHVNPVISSVTAIDDNNVPQTSAREAETTVMVKDGETIVIGGLIRDEHSKVVQAVPFLSQLPIVGELFKNRTNSKRRTDVIVTITPRIVRDNVARPTADGEKKG